MDQEPGHHHRRSQARAPSVRLDPLEAPSRRRTELEARWEEAKKEADAGRRSLVEEDESGYPAYDYGEHMGDMLSEVEAVQKIIREAFVIGLFHLWERETNKYRRTQDSVAFLRSMGFQPDEKGIEVLELAANAAKHGPGRSMGALYGVREDFFDAAKMQKDGVSEPTYDYLTITEQHVEELFQVVRKAWS